MRVAARILPLLVALLAACPSPTPRDPTGNDVPTETTDPLEERPTLGDAVPYRAPQAEVFATERGTKVWLVERHDLPVVALTLSVPYGSADDPLGGAGLAHITTSMLDEGAGERTAVEIASDIQRLGARLGGRVSVDGSRVSLYVLKKHLSQAFDIFADVIARPHFDPDEWKRVKRLWRGRLDKRSDDPASVAGVVRRAVLYGPETPYGHPTSGYPSTAGDVELSDLESFYRTHWRPDRAQLVVAGDVDRAELERLWEASLGDWEATDEAPGTMDPPKPLETRPQVVVVDQPDAPQAVLSVVGPGVSADDPERPLLELVNTALGGSFTSRLNQNLREDHSWTYGARSTFRETRGVGGFIASSAVELAATGAALREMLREIETMAKDGLTQGELVKTRAQDLTDMMENHETVGRVSSRLSTLAVLGLDPDYDAEASEARQAASLEQLNALAERYLAFDRMSIVVVGPAKVVRPQLDVLDLGEPVVWTAEGRPSES